MPETVGAIPDSLFKGGPRVVSQMEMLDSIRPIMFNLFNIIRRYVLHVGDKLYSLFYPISSK